MKLLLTSAGIGSTSIHNTLVDLLGKPVAGASALFVLKAIYALPIGADIARKVIHGSLGDPFCELAWKSLGVLELPHCCSPIVVQQNGLNKMETFMPLIKKYLKRTFGWAHVWLIH